MPGRLRFSAGRGDVGTISGSWRWYRSVRGGVGHAPRWAPQMPSTHGTMRFTSVPIVFQSDDDGPIRKLVNLVVSPGELSFDHPVDLRQQTVEHTFAFRLCMLPSVLVLVKSWLAASFGRPLPVRHRDLALRKSSARRRRLTIAPPWPLDFVVHLYGTDDFDVEAVMERFLHAAA